MTHWNIMNDTFPHDHPSAPAPWAMKIGLSIAGMVAVTGGVCNFGAVAVLVKEASTKQCRRMVSVTSDTMLILQLAMVDLLYCSVSLPLMMVTSLSSVPPPHVLCVAAAFIRIINANVEFNTLGLVAVERFYHIKRGHKSSGLFSVRLTKLYCSGVWVVGVCLQLPILATGQYGFNRSTYKCDIMVSEQVRWLVVLIECLLPLAVILISYVAILRQVRHSRALLAKYMDSQDTRSGGQAARLLRRYKVASRSLLGLVILYLVCILPVALYNIIGQDGQWKELGILLYCLYWLQYVANTIIYVMSSARYRMALRVFLRGIFMFHSTSKRSHSSLHDWSHVGQLNSSLNLRKSVGLN
ncbi:protein trapped in endoderm-1-like [Panulirus ornatus]|uniref:protein trapped in endoderm-1-like n=1 Tax=Panulirus ornatus TaxID=150431 RepID=UPI003A8777A4